MTAAPHPRVAHFSAAADMRRRFLTIVLAATLGWNVLIVAATLAGLLPFEGLQAANNFAFLVVNAVLFASILRWPRRVAEVASAYLLGGYYLIICALFQVPQDQLRMLLFFPALGAVFLMVGSGAGWFAVLVSFAAFSLAFATGYLDITTLAFSTFFLTLTMTALFFHAFRAQALRALETISAQNAALDAAARLDPLTGLLNLRAFREAMDVASAGATSYAVAFLDVDHFKSINDRHGHAGGDAVLAAVADALRATVRPNDVLARIGGEEFAVLMPGVEAETAGELGEVLRGTVERTRVRVADEDLAVTVSIGIALSAGDPASVDSLLRRADAAMYLAKGDGRNRVTTAAAP